MVESVKTALMSDEPGAVPGLVAAKSAVMLQSQVQGTECQPQDPGSKTEPGAPSASQYFRGKCSSDTLSITPGPQLLIPLIRGHPPVRTVSNWLGGSAFPARQY